MTVNEKIRAFGVSGIAAYAGCSVSIVYRWVKALEQGEGVNRDAMIVIIKATAGSDFAVTWSDFEPVEFRPGGATVLAGARVE